MRSPDNYPYHEAIGALAAIGVALAASSNIVGYLLLAVIVGYLMIK